MRWSGLSEDGFDNLLTVTSKDTGLTRYAYSIDGLVTEKEDAQGRLDRELVKTEYDGLRRPVAVKRRFHLEVEVCRPPDVCPPIFLPREEVLTSFAYDTGSHALGRLVERKDFVGAGQPIVTTFSWDDEGRLAGEHSTRPGLAHPLSLGFHYRVGGKLDQLAYPAVIAGGGASQQTVLDISHGSDDEVERLDFGGVAFATNITHHPFGGGLESFTRGNRRATSIAQDKDGRRTGVTAPNDEPLSLSYRFDSRGLVRGLRELGDVPRERAFDHDELGRLKLAEYRDSPGAPLLFSESFDYDPAGNRLLKTRDTGKRFISVFDWKPESTDADKLPDNNLLRTIIDPLGGDDCQPKGSGPASGGCPGKSGRTPEELAKLEATWKELLNQSRETLRALPGLTETELRARTVAWVEALRAMLSRYRLSASTLQFLLLDAESGPHGFAETLTEFLGRRAAGAPVSEVDLALLQRMLQLAETVQIRRAVEADPNWHYSYDAAGNVTSVTLEQLPPSGSLRGRIETTYCYRLDALRRLVKVEWLVRSDLAALNAPPPCSDPAKLTLLALYRYDSRNLRVYSQVLGLETHFVFSPDGQLLAEANAQGSVERQYIYLEGEPLAQVVTTEGFNNRPLPTAMGCSSTGDTAGWVAGALVALALLGRRRRRLVQASAVVLILSMQGCKLEDGLQPLGKENPQREPHLRPARLSGRSSAGDPTYYFHTDRLGTPLRLTDKSGNTVWRAEYRPFGDLESLEVDPDGDGVPVENNLRLPGQYDEALGSVLLFQQGPYYNGQRWYLPGEGRYASSDPALMPGLPMSGVPFLTRAWLRTPERMQPYTYVTNSPLEFTDPEGLARVCNYCRQTQLRIKAENGGERYLKYLECADADGVYGRQPGGKGCVLKVGDLGQVKVTCDYVARDPLNDVSEAVRRSLVEPEDAPGWKDEEWLKRHCDWPGCG